MSEDDIFEVMKKAEFEDIIEAEKILFSAKSAPVVLVAVFFIPLLPILWIFLKSKECFTQGGDQK